MENGKFIFLKKNIFKIGVIDCMRPTCYSRYDGIAQYSGPIKKRICQIPNIPDFGISRNGFVFYSGILELFRFSPNTQV